MLVHVPENARYNQTSDEKHFKLQFLAYFLIVYFSGTVVSSN